MKLKRNLIMLTIVAAVAYSCNGSSSSMTPQEKLEGKWVVDNAELLGGTIQGDGSYLQFDACDGAGSCTGIDFMADDTTTGSFSYVLYEEDSLVITDTMSEGGAWTATWDILELSETKLRMIANSIFGTVKYEFNKE